MSSLGENLGFQHKFLHTWNLQILLGAVFKSGFSKVNAYSAPNHCELDFQCYKVHSLQYRAKCKCNDRHFLTHTYFKTHKYVVLKVSLFCQGR